MLLLALHYGVTLLVRSSLHAESQSAIDINGHVVMESQEARTIELRNGL